MHAFDNNELITKVSHANGACIGLHPNQLKFLIWAGFYCIIYDCQTILRLPLMNADQQRRDHYSAFKSIKRVCGAHDHIKVFRKMY